MADSVWNIWLLVIIGGVLAALSYWWGMHQFGGFDHSVMISVAWRLYCGDRPYVDFPCTLPVGFYLGAEMAFRIFGVAWSSLIKINTLYFLITYFWLYQVLRSVCVERLWPLFLTVVCECLTLIRASYWWYNPITSIAEILFFASVVAVMRKPDRNLLWASVCISMALAATMKPNTAGILLSGGTLALFLDQRTRKQILVVVPVAFLLWMAAISIHGSTILQVLSNYFSVATYAFTTRRDGCVSIAPAAVDWWCAGLAIAGFAFALFRRNKTKIDYPWLIFITFTMLTGAMAFLTNAEPRLDALSLIFLAAALVTFDRDISIKRRLTFIAIGGLFVALSLHEAASRERIKGIGLGAFYEDQIDKVPIQQGFFKGLYTGYDLKNSIRVIDELIKTTDCSRIYFGTRMQWAYAAFGIRETAGVPAWWQPGVSFGSGDEAAYTDRWIECKFSPLVMTDFLFLNKQIMTSLKTDYSAPRKVRLNPDSWGLLILTRKN